MRKIISGIYQIICVANGKYYIGSSNNIYKRKSAHFRGLILNKHFNSYLQNTYNKYGKENFVFIIIEDDILENELINTEQVYLDEAKLNKNKVFNSSFIAERPEHTQEVLQKISQAHLGKHHSEEHNRKISEANSGKNHWSYGKPFSIQHKENLSKSHKGILSGIKRPKEYCDKMSLFWTDKFKNGFVGGMSGKHHSEESKQKSSLSHKGSKNHNFDNNIYTFKNRITNEIFKGHKFDFYTKYNLYPANVNNLINKERHSHHDWILVETEVDYR